MLKLIILNWAFNTLNYCVKYTQLYHYLTHLDANNYFYSVRSFQMIKFIFYYEVYNSFCCYLSRIYISSVDILLYLKFHTTNVASSNFSTPIELEIGIYIGFTSVTSQRTMNINRMNLIWSKRSYPSSQRKYWLFRCVIDYYACWTNKLRSSIIIVFRIR